MEHRYAPAITCQVINESEVCFSLNLVVSSRRPLLLPAR